MEVCKDSDLRWPEIRASHLTGSELKYFLSNSSPYVCKKGRRAAKMAKIDPEFKAKRDMMFASNEDIRRGHQLQSQAAAAYSAATGRTLVEVGCLVGPRPKDAEFAKVPECMSATLDYISLEDGVLVEIKCPRGINRHAKKYYWAQCQLQMQLARAPTLHLVQYVAASEMYPGNLDVTVIHVDSLWFNSIVSLSCKEWNQLNLIKKDNKNILSA